MYFEFFGFSEPPFTITPDPRYLFMSERHQEALAHLLYGIKESHGFVQLTGEVGTGKTTLVRALLEQLPANVEIALILNPKLTAKEFVASICDELKIAYAKDSQSIKALVDALNIHLLDAHASGKRTVLIVDEAQNLDTEVLEQIRLLTNLETSKHKLLHIILVGQPELRELLAQPELRQLAQRITARYHLIPLSAEEVAEYVNHRLKVAGCKRKLFSSSALRSVHASSAGIPRLINIICDRALLGAYARDENFIEAKMLRQAAAEVQNRPPAQPKKNSWWLYAVITVLAITAGFFAAESNFLRSLIAPMASTAPPQPENTRNGELGSGSAEERLAGAIETAQPTAHANESGAPVILDNLLMQDLASTEEAALKALFRRWNLAYDDVPGTSGCEKAVAQGLKCLRLKGTLEELLRLNYPVLLQFTGDKAKQYFAMTALEEELAVLEFGDERFRVPKENIEKHWPGEWLLLWKPPALDAEIIFPGSSGELVLWLRRNLDKVIGPVPGQGPADFYDEGLKQRVTQFQRLHSLTEDGLAGAHTLIYLTAASGDPLIPLLKSKIQ